MSAEFTLLDARARLPYLEALGVSHVYCSPVFSARAGSTHGYDVTDPTQVSELLGGEEALVALADDAHARGLGILLDIVPNHMGIGPENPYWEDVLMHGRASRYADWFDVSWRATSARLEGKVLVPVLGDTLAHVLERGEITIEDGRVKYFDRSFPLDPSTPHTDDVKSLLAKQHYVLAFWRTAQRDVNYRRFFDVNELISLRVEREDVFAATHAKVLQLVGRGIVDGLRVDHIDGLLEPRRYLERLRQAVGVQIPRLRPPGSARNDTFPIYVEKILAHGETLPEDWPVDGTTGYEFLVALEDLFIDPAGAAEIEARYRGAREQRGFHRVSVASKRSVLRSALNADVRRVAPMLARLAEKAGWPGCTVAQYAQVIVEFIAALPVYRTYIDAESVSPTPSDRRVIEKTFADVREWASVDVAALSALERALLDDWRGGRDLAAARLNFVLRLQQLSGPAAAKGVEDTALYVYAPLTSRSEVGADPAVRVDGAVERLTDRLQERAKRFPLSLNATNTHDTKRSADARARIDALSEHPTEWRRTLARWRRAHRELRPLVRGKRTPAAPTDDFLYQSLLAVWPLTPPTLADGPWLAELCERLSEYLLKASREAKVSTSWTDPDEAYEAALSQFITTLMQQPAFLEEVAGMVSLLAPQALWNALGRVVVHLMSPGVPDIYQGDELWYSALVDPDNRRSVDWEERARVLSEVGSHSLVELRDGMRAGELKMFVLRELLAVRRAHSLGGAAFRMLGAEVELRDHVFAFQRKCTDGAIVSVMVAKQTGGLGWPPVGSVWGDTSIPLIGRHSRVLHGGELSADGAARLADVFRVLPVEVLVSKR